jgi:hypothetical protein
MKYKTDLNKIINRIREEKNQVSDYFKFHKKTHTHTHTKKKKKSRRGGEEKVSCINLDTFTTPLWLF